jgi:hypothetical protein
MGPIPTHCKRLGRGVDVCGNPVSHATLEQLEVGAELGPP